jgi:hypothetical protein
VVLLVVVVALNYEPPPATPGTPAAPARPAAPGTGLGVSAEELRRVFELDRNGGFVFTDERGSGSNARLVGSSAAGRLDLLGDPANLQQISLTVESDQSHLVELLALQVVPDLAADVESVIEEAPEGRPETLEGVDAIVTLTLNPEPNDDIEMLVEALGV